MDELKNHLNNVHKYSMSLGRKINLSEDELYNLSMAACLHDIGKNYINKKVLNKPGPLNDYEKEIMKQHTILGADYLKRKGFNQEIVDAVLFHHERWDGEGYLNGLKGEEIPLLARIISVADSYDAMTSERIYRTNIKNTKEAVCELERCSGTQFDPYIVREFIKLIC